MQQDAGPNAGGVGCQADFGDKATFIARKVSWSLDGKSILAALAEGDSDIVSLSGERSIGRR